MFDFLKSLFNPAPPSGSTAKERLRLVLLSDHLSLAPDVVEALKKDLLAVISRYVTIDSAHADVTFEHRENEVAMLANIPITGVRERDRPAPYDAAPPKPSVPNATVATATVAVAEPAVEPDLIARVEAMPTATTRVEADVPSQAVRDSEALAGGIVAEDVVAGGTVADPTTVPPPTRPALFDDANEKASVATDARTVANADATANTTATPDTVPGKAAQRRRRRKKASNALANAAERKAANPPQPGYSAQA